MFRALLAVLGVAVFGAGAAVGIVPAGDPDPFVWDIPRPFPAPPVPTDNPMSPARVELGRRLFYDTRMSVNGEQSCGSCHIQSLAFTDGKARAVGTTGEMHPRGAMSLANIAYNPSLTWDDAELDRLEDQALVPIFGTDPIELGLEEGREERFLAEIRGLPVYQELFRDAFDAEPDPWTMENVTRAIAAFQRTLISVRSPYDRYRYGGEPDALGEAAKRGEIIFFSGQKAACFQCHGGWNFSGVVNYESGEPSGPAFENTGLYNLPGEYSYPAPNTGLFRHTGRPEDIGRFKVPTLRNIEVTAPYMHDGSIATLEEVIEHYAAGGRTIANGPNAGVGSANPNKATNVDGFTLTDAEKRDLIEFLKSLTDESFLTDPRFADPWR